MGQTLEEAIDDLKNLGVDASVEARLDRIEEILILNHSLHFGESDDYPPNYGDHSHRTCRLGDLVRELRIIREA